MQNMKTKLTARDFTYLYEPGIGQTYQCGAYMIIVVGRSYYTANYQGRTIAYNLRDFLSAIEACAKHDAKRTADLLEEAVLREMALLEKRTGIKLTRRNQEGK